jgi:hypothetical protein
VLQALRLKRLGPVYRAALILGAQRGGHLVLNHKEVLSVKCSNLTLRNTYAKVSGPNPALPGHLNQRLVVHVVRQEHPVVK